MNAPVMAIYSIDDLSISMFLKKTTLFNVFLLQKLHFSNNKPQKRGRKIKGKCLD